MPLRLRLPANWPNHVKVVLIINSIFFDKFLNLLSSILATNRLFNDVLDERSRSIILYGVIEELRIWCNCTVTRLFNWIHDKFFLFFVISELIDILFELFRALISQLSQLLLVHLLFINSGLFDLFCVFIIFIIFLLFLLYLSLICVDFEPEHANLVAHNEDLVEDFCNVLNLLLIKFLYQLGRFLSFLTAFLRDRFYH